ncbi:XRE family transcriptional regulator, partial [Salmonella sp. gx-f8]|nr:XRE family transcriptional regulator [Salmonella sp. gx-f8]
MAAGHLPAVYQCGFPRPVTAVSATATVLANPLGESIRMR